MPERQLINYITILQQKFYLPPFILENEWAAKNYKRWLQKRAYKHILTDRYRFPEQNNTVITIENYLARIHEAVAESKGKDYYTNEPLDWGLILKQTNETSRTLKRNIKDEFRMLPVVAHDNPDNPTSAFRICSFQTLDYKREVDIKEILKFSNKVIKNMSVTGKRDFLETDLTVS